MLFALLLEHIVRHPPFVALFLAALAACSSADRSIGPSSEGLTIPGSLVPPDSKSAARPLSGTCTTTVSRLAPPPTEVQHFELTCHLSHLGLTQATLTQTVDVTTGALSGTGVYVAANGDELAFTFTGTAELSFTDPTDATVTFEAVQDLSGGTGRFAAADGAAQVAGTTRLNLITGSGTGELTLDGALAY
jgi:hypothetical protein